MRLRRASDRHALAGAGFYAFAGALAAVAGVVVGWTKVRQAVVVAWAYVVDRVRAGQATQVADVPVGGVDGGLGAAGGLPVTGEASTAIRALPPAAGHPDASSLVYVMDLIRLYNYGEIGLEDWTAGLQEAADLARREI